MIFVTTGTLIFPFDRLIKSVLRIHSQLDEKTPLILQIGVSSISGDTLAHLPASVKTHSFLPHNKMVFYYKRAHLVISAGGEGSVVDTLSYARHKPIIFPRLSRFNEHVDDQQLCISQTLQRRGLVFHTTTEGGLQKLIKKLLVHPVKNNRLPPFTNRRLLRYLDQASVLS